MENPFIDYAPTAINEVFSDNFKNERVTEKVNAYAAEVTARLVKKNEMEEFIQGEEFTFDMTLDDLKPHLVDLEDATLRELATGIMVCGLMNATEELSLVAEEGEEVTPFGIMVRQKDEAANAIEVIAQVLPSDEIY